MKDSGLKIIVVEQDRAMEVWRAHYDKISNEEFTWDRKIYVKCVGLVKGFRHWKWVRQLVR